MFSSDLFMVNDRFQAYGAKKNFSTKSWNPPLWADTVDVFERRAVLTSAMSAGDADQLCEVSDERLRFAATQDAKYKGGLVV